MTTSPPIDRDAAVAAPLRADPTERGRRLDAAYDEYCRRQAAGATVDHATFCKRFSDLQDSLARLLAADEFLDVCSDLYDDPKAPAVWPEVGAVWEGFHLLEELGRGSFARVYLARELALGERLVAVKCAVQGPAEAATLGRLDHPHIVPIHSIRKLKGKPSMLVCMPYLGRATLDQVGRRLHAADRPLQKAAVILDVCRDARLPAATPPAVLRRGSYVDGVRWIAAGVAGALAYLHARGICHRDLKPSNILLQPDGAPRLLDFNLSLDAQAPDRLNGGTMYYMAPEQIVAWETKNNAGLTPQLDVFSLGVILYEWLTGRHPYAPWPADLKGDALGRHLLEKYQVEAPPLPVTPGVDRPLARLLQRCLAFRPEERPTAADIERSLRRQLRLPHRLWRGLAGRPRSSACAAVALTAVLALGGYNVANQPPRSQVAYQQGWQAYRAGDYQKAWTHFSEALTEGANDADCLFARGRACQRLGEMDKEFFHRALADYLLAHQRAPRGETAAGMGYCAQRLGMMDSSRARYQQALAYGIAAPALEYNLGCLDLDQAKLEDARVHFENALALDDGLRSAHCLMADVLVRQAQQEPSEDLPMTVNGSLPDWLRRALAHLQRGLPEDQPARAPLALLAAQVHALAIPYDPTHREAVFRWLERAVAEGLNPAALRSNPLLRDLHADPRFGALLQRPQVSRPAAASVLVIDPFDYQSLTK